MAALVHVVCERAGHLHENQFDCLHMMLVSESHVGMAQYMQYLSKSHIISPQTRRKLI